MSKVPPPEVKYVVFVMPTSKSKSAPPAIISAALLSFLRTMSVPALTLLHSAFVVKVNFPPPSLPMLLEKSFMIMPRISRLF